MASPASRATPPGRQFRSRDGSAGCCPHGRRRGCVSAYAHITGGSRRTLPTTTVERKSATAMMAVLTD